MSQKTCAVLGAIVLFVTVPVAVAGTSPRELTFEERVDAQVEIERVFHMHRTGATRVVQAAAMRNVLSARVRKYLAQTRELEQRWNQPITVEMLQREVERMKLETRMPARLAELFDALGNEPVLIRECLARPRLVERLLNDYSGADDGEARAAFPVTASSGAGLMVRLTGDPTGCSTGGWHHPLSERSIPARRSGAQVVWTGSEMLVSGYLMEEDRHLVERYDPTTDTWTTASSPEETTGYEAAVWTGSEMILWGGIPAGPGARYDPISDTWAALATEGAPAQRTRGYTAVWTGSEMIVWGGKGSFYGSYMQTGGRYDPATDSWTPTATLGAPDPRQNHTAVWTGAEMIVWGGLHITDDSELYFSPGGRYDPVGDTWTTVSATGAPSNRYRHTAIWTGEEMIVWGGESGSVGAPFTLDSGGFYNPTVDLDEDGYCGLADCDETDPTVHHDAPEINDGIDNQCPGDYGFDLVDEISGEVRVGIDGWLSWPAQSGATLYQVARSSLPDFSSDCVSGPTPSATLQSLADPDPATCWYYLVRALAPNEGSWGIDSGGSERVVIRE